MKLIQTARTFGQFFIFIIFGCSFQEKKKKIHGTKPMKTTDSKETSTISWPTPSKTICIGSSHPSLNHTFPDSILYQIANFLTRPIQDLATLSQTIHFSIQSFIKSTISWPRPSRTRFLGSSIFSFNHTLYLNLHRIDHSWPTSSRSIFLGFVHPSLKPTLFDSTPYTIDYFRPQPPRTIFFESTISWPRPSRTRFHASSHPSISGSKFKVGRNRYDWCSAPGGQKGPSQSLSFSCVLTEAFRVVEPNYNVSFIIPLLRHALPRWPILKSSVHAQLVFPSEIARSAGSVSSQGGWQFELSSLPTSPSTQPLFAPVGHCPFWPHPAQQHLLCRWDWCQKRIPHSFAMLNALREKRLTQSTQFFSGRSHGPAIRWNIAFCVVCSRRFSVWVMSEHSQHHNAVCGTDESNRLIRLLRLSSLFPSNGHNEWNLPQAAAARQRISAEHLPIKVNWMLKTLKPSDAQTIGIDWPFILIGATLAPGWLVCTKHPSLNHTFLYSFFYQIDHSLTQPIQDQISWIWPPSLKPCISLPMN